MGKNGNEPDDEEKGYIVDDPSNWQSSKSDYTTPAWNNLKGQLEIIYAAVAVLIVADVVASLGNEHSLWGVESLLEEPTFGFVAFPLLAGCVLQMTVQTFFDQTDWNITSQKKGWMSGAGVVVLSVLTVFEETQPLSIGLSAIIFGGALLYAAFRGAETRGGQIITGILGIGLVVIGVNGLMVVYLPSLL